MGEWKAKIHIPFGDAFPQKKESGRMSRLITTTSCASLYVHAVTYDANDYLANFWQGQVSHEYIQTNIEAIRREVAIRRIFIVSKSILDNTDRDGHKILKAVILEHKKFMAGNQKCFVKVICQDNIPPNLKTYKTSFLTCDDCVASESFIIDNENETAGYVRYNDKAVLEELNERFNAFSVIQDETDALLRTRRGVR